MSIKLKILGRYIPPVKKLPLTKGFGYYGLQRITTDRELLECHLCGNLYRSVGSHVMGFHKMRVRAYQNMFGLACNTSLTSPAMRDESRRLYYEWWNSLDKKKKAKLIKNNRKYSAIGRSRVKTHSHALSAETVMRRGTSPEQVIAKIISVKNILGKTPTLDEFVYICQTQRYKHKVFELFGSWINALKVAKLTPVVPKISRNGGVKYLTKDLINYLHTWVERERKIPTSVHFGHGILPDYETYIRRFGSIERARRRAKVYDIVPKPEYPNVWKKGQRWSSKVA